MNISRFIGEDTNWYESKNFYNFLVDPMKPNFDMDFLAFDIGFDLHKEHNWNWNWKNRFNFAKHDIINKIYIRNEDELVYSLIEFDNKTTVLIYDIIRIDLNEWECANGEMSKFFDYINHPLKFEPIVFIKFINPNSIFILDVKNAILQNQFKYDKTNFDPIKYQYSFSISDIRRENVQFPLGYIYFFNEIDNEIVRFDIIEEINKELGLNVFTAKGWIHLSNYERKPCLIRGDHSKHIEIIKISNFRYSMHISQSEYCARLRRCFFQFIGEYDFLKNKWIDFRYEITSDSGK